MIPLHCLSAKSNIRTCVNWNVTQVGFGCVLISFVHVCGVVVVPWFVGEGEGEGVAGGRVGWGSFKIACPWLGVWKILDVDRRMGGLENQTIFMYHPLLKIKFSYESATKPSNLSIYFVKRFLKSQFLRNKSKQHSFL